jgi:ferrous iron transport protein B
MSRIILIGSPNSGKSLLFNRLTGLQQKVANFPGITVDVGSGALQDLPGVTLVDFPGTYSLQPISGEEQVAVNYFREALDDPEVSQVLCLVDATRLEKSLYFTLQVIRESARHGKHVTVLANMMDVLEKHKIEIDLAGLSALIKAPILPVSARTGAGIDALLEKLKANHQQPLTEDQAALKDTPDELLRGTAHQLAQRFGPRGEGSLSLPSCTCCSSPSLPGRRPPWMRWKRYWVPCRISWCRPFPTRWPGTLRRMRFSAVLAPSWCSCRRFSC